jgi:transposase
MLAGIEEGWEEYTITLLKASGEVFSLFKISNNCDGYMNLLDRMRETVEDIVFAIESRNTRLVDFLIAQGYTGYYVDPNALKDYRKRYKSAPVKSDELDSFILADLLRTDRNNLTEIALDNPFIRELKRLLMDREHFVQDKVRLPNRSKACLREYYPEALQFFNDPTGKVALDYFEQYPTIKGVKQLLLEVVDRFLRQRGCYQKEIAERIIRICHGHTITVPAESIKVKGRMLLGLVKQLRGVNETISDYERAIEELLKSCEKMKQYTSLPGVGLIIGGALYTLFEGWAGLNGLSGIRAYVGMAPVTYQSGQFKGVSFRFACNHFYRNIFQQMAFCSLKESGWAREHYRRKRREGKSHHHALRSLGDLWVKVVYAIRRTGEAYDEQKHLASIARFWLGNNSHSQMA